jgi:anti-sigma regulatory factor (Ser/Thr protein kinase)
MGARSDLERLRAACQRQAHTVEMLTATVATLRRGAAALKAENDELRALASRGLRGWSRADGGEASEVLLPLDVHAPGAARMVVADLRGRVSEAVLGCALLVVSELVTNSVRHAGAAVGGSVAVRVQLTDTMVRVEVADPGRGGVIAPRTADLDGGGGFGLAMVAALSERWGLERVAVGGTRVWAQLTRAPKPARASADASGRGRRELWKTDETSGGRAAGERRRLCAGG